MTPAQQDEDETNANPLSSTFPAGERTVTVVPPDTKEDDRSSSPEQIATNTRPLRTLLSTSGTNLLAHIATHLQTPHNLHDVEAAAARFDVTPFRLWLLFQSVDDNHDGFISQQELVHALTASSSHNNNNNDMLGILHKPQEEVTPTPTPKATSQGLPPTPPPLQRTNSSASSGKTSSEYISEMEDDDEEGDEEFLALQDLEALDELFQRVVGYDQNGNDVQLATTGISFPQFCRILRYLWLQQLLNPELDNSLDPNGTYTFECVDYASGYYRRQKAICGNCAHKRSRDFFAAPRHGHARMRWIDVPSGRFVPYNTITSTTNNINNDKKQQQSKNQQHNYQAESVRMTLLRLAVKYRFHPTSLEDAILLEEQEPKVNSFEHSLLDLGNFQCGTISWLRDAGQDGHSNEKNNGNPPTIAASMSNNAAAQSQDLQNQCKTNNANSSTNINQSVTGSSAVSAIPRPQPAQRTSSTQSFHSHYATVDAALGNANIENHIPDFVMAEGEDDINIHEGRHYFITIPMFELSRRSQTSLDLYQETSELLPLMQLKPLLIEVNEATLGIFVASLPDANLVVTCSTKWRPTRIKPHSYRHRHKQQPSKRPMSKHHDHGLFSLRSVMNHADENDKSSSSSSSGSSSSDDDDGDDWIQSILQDEKMALERVKQLLKKRHSIQRHRNSNWLMHAIIDAVVDNLVPISKAYEAQLQQMSSRLFELQHRLSRREVKEMIVMRRDLEWLQHELKPFARVIRHLIDDKNIGAEVTHYLEDVEDHLLRTVDELSSYASECMSLKDEYNAYLDRRMNDILYILTLVTTLVVPGQFLTGYYGMNFENSDGSLGAPLLRQGSLGVAIFWCMTTGFTFLVVLIMYRANFFEKELE